MFQIDPQQVTLNASDMPGIYRQTTETTGMYDPFTKRNNHNQQIQPSKKCSSQKILPSQDFISHYSSTKKINSHQSLDIFKNSYSLPQLQNILEDDSSEYEHFYEYYAQTRKSNSKIQHKNHHRPEPPLPLTDYHTRPYTPPEKRYNSSFGQSTPKKSKFLAKQRPKSGCIYDDVYMPEDYCVRKSNEKIVNHFTNVRVSDFPTLKFNQMYVQDNFDE